ncbi:hypothetical protein JKA74_10495 [Marivirga sp. S37H4]|uniref:Uncharacterized protein n=1 Tax=Marivirga aurantiaca TaxID=2802615 RepID=A0A935C885_9BACT|nr:hypothetical protein [Marivirga aurantiaca]MBK6265466.1 hypothetical protein [Marivirga aurantiaca]
MINYLVLVLTICANPFLGVLNSQNQNIFEYTSEILEQDEREYLIYDQTRKVTNPERFNFLGDSIVFMAYKDDSSSTSSSIICYIRGNEQFLDKAIESFGQPNSVFKVGAEIDSNNFPYQSTAWKKNGFMMLISIANKIPEDDRNIYRVWIRKFR